MDDGQCSHVNVPVDLPRYECVVDLAIISRSIESIVRLDLVIYQVDLEKLGHPSIYHTSSTL